MLLYLLTTIVLFGIVIFGFSETGNIDTYGVNRTIGWAYNYNVCLFVPLYGAFALISYTIGYAMLSVLKRRVHHMLSATHFVVVLLILVGLFIAGRDATLCWLILVLTVFSIVVLIANSIYAFRNG